MRKAKRGARYAYAEKLEIEQGLGKVQQWEEYNAKFDPMKDRYKGHHCSKFIATMLDGSVYEVEIYKELKAGDFMLYKMIRQHAREQALIKSANTLYHTQIEKEVLFIDNGRVVKYMIAKRYQ